MPPIDPHADVTDSRVDENGDYWYHVTWTDSKVANGKRAAGAAKQTLEVDEHCHAWFPACSLGSG